MNKYYFFNNPFNGTKFYLMQTGSDIIVSGHDYISGFIVQILNEKNNIYAVGEKYNWNSKHCTLVTDKEIIKRLDKLLTFS